MPVNYLKATSDSHLKVVMERISELMGKTVNVHSGDRNFVPKGGSKTSLHLAHRAVDFHIADMSDSAVLQKILQNIPKVFSKSEGYEFIHHGAYTATGGPHLHIGHYDGGHKGQVIYKHEGLTPATKGVYSPETLTIGDGSPITTPTSTTGSHLTPKSVGKGGINASEDVSKIQHLLNIAQQRLIASGTNFERFKPLKEDGLIGIKTIEAITIFQRDIVKMSSPDGRIDPDGRTLKVLQTIANGKPEILKSQVDIAVTAPAANSNFNKNSAPELLVTERHIRAFLDVLAFTEGTGNNYGKVVNGTVISAPFNPELVGKVNVSITDFSRHPNILVRLNASLKSTAAGRYQFLKSTWDELGMPNFNAASQDIAAVKLMKRRGMITPLLANELRTAVTNGAPEWASLPTAAGGSFYGGQPAKSFQQISATYNEALKKYA
jgi:muramidase (phage lysozyme)